MNFHPKILAMPAQTRAAEIRATSFDEAANTIDVIWTTGATVRRRSWDDGDFDEELVVSANAVRMDRLNAGAPFLNTHSGSDLADVIGSVVPGSAELRAGKGYAKIALSRAPGDADIVSKIKDGIIRNISVGYRIYAVERTEAKTGGVTQVRVTDWEPMEISAVPVPADAGAQIRSTDAGERFPCIVKRADASLFQGQGGHLTMSETETDTADIPQVLPADPLMRKAITAERKRANAIREICRGFGERDFGEAHIEAGTDWDIFRSILHERILAKQEASGVFGGNHISDGARVIGASNAEQRREAVAGALLHRYDAGKYKLDDNARSFRGLTLIEMARQTLESEGIRTDGMARMEIAERALIAGSRSGGAMSSSDFPNILANVANKTLRDAYEAAPQTFRPIVRETTVPDFKMVSRNQLGEAPQLEKVNEHGEFRRGSMGEAVEKYAILTYGKVVAVTRQVIINDDLNAFTRLPMAFGIQAANLESDLVWAQILANPVMGDGVALFHASHGNLGAAGGIAIDTIAAGREAMRLQKGIDGKTPLNITPGYVITSVAAETKAAQLLTQITPAQTSNVVPQYMRTLAQISEPRLDSGFVNPATGAAVAGSRFAWYLAAAPGLIDTVELAYLEGNRGVYTETRQGFDVDGVEVKVRMDVGAKTIDWRGLFKNPATAL